MKKYFTILLFIELLIISIIMKILYVNIFFMPHDQNYIYTILQIIYHDSSLFFFIVLFTYLSYLKFTNYYLSVIFRFISLIIFIFYLLDLIILNNFTTHLVLEDVIKYINYIPRYLNQEYDFNIFHLLIILVSIYFIFSFILKQHKINHKLINLSSISILLIILPLPFLAEDGRYVHSWVYKNFINYNIEVYKQSKEYSTDFENNIHHIKKEVCSKNENNRFSKNVIILMVESLSSYQSKFFSGIKDWTPNLDVIASNNISFKNFHSNGFMTEDAEISILTGKFPIYPPKIFSDGGGVSFAGFYNINDSLANIFNKYKYSTEFITSADLNFSNTGNWAKSIGFKYVEGSNNKFYENKKRYHFEAASDEFLFERVLERINYQSKYFMFIKTVSSHVPFINPENDKKSEEETIRYVDKQIGNFYQKLEEINFFNNGILIILGDHHPLIPLKNEQLTLYGETIAHTFIPMIIVNNENKESITDDYQQTDIYHSIKNMFSKEICTDEWHGDFFNKINPKYIVYRRGDKRGVISVFSKDINYNVILNGDDTYIDHQKNNINIINKINYERIQAKKNMK